MLMGSEVEIIVHHVSFVILQVFWSHTSIVWKHKWDTFTENLNIFSCWQVHEKYNDIRSVNKKNHLICIFYIFKFDPDHKNGMFFQIKIDQVLSSTLDWLNAVNVNKWWLVIIIFWVNPLKMICI